MILLSLILSIFPFLFLFYFPSFYVFYIQFFPSTLDSLLSSCIDSFSCAALLSTFFYYPFRTNDYFIFNSILFYFRYFFLSFSLSPRRTFYSFRFLHCSSLQCKNEGESTKAFNVCWHQQGSRKKNVFSAFYCRWTLYFLTISCEAGWKKVHRLCLVRWEKWFSVLNRYQYTNRKRWGDKKQKRRKKEHTLSQRQRKSGGKRKKWRIFFRENGKTYERINAPPYMNERSIQAACMNIEKSTHKKKDQ